MRIVNVIVEIFAVFAFLTIGSLLFIVSLDILTMEDALLKVQKLYEEPWQSLKIGFAGGLFIFMGIVFSKLLVRETRSSSDLVLYGKMGCVSVSSKAIEALVRRFLEREEGVRNPKIRIDVDGNRLSVRANISVLEKADIAALKEAVENKLAAKLQGLIGDGVETEIAVNVKKIIDDPLFKNSTAGDEDKKGGS